MPSRYEKVTIIIRKLLEKTARREVQWEKTAAEGAFLTSFPDYSVLLYEAYSATGRLDRVFEIRDSEAVLVERITDDELFSESDSSDLPEIMSNLYKEARRIAMGADEALDKMLTYLEA